MNVVLEIPEDLTAPLRAGLGEPATAALAALAARAYESGGFSVEQVRRLLRLPTRWEAQAVLSKHGVWPGTTVEDLRSDLASLEKLRSAPR